LTRLVLDASTFLSATVAKPDTPLARLMAAAQSGAVEIVICEQLLEEVRRGLEKPYFRERLTVEERQGIPDALARIGLLLADPVAPPSVVRDPGDDYLVELAKMSKAAFIVTGDGDLLDHEGLHPPAINAREACARLPREPSGRRRSVAGWSRLVSPLHGSHGMSRETVAAHQRARLLGAMVESVHRRGYQKTSVAHVIALAGVSRRAFYEQFANKQACFEQTFAITVARSRERMLEGWQTERGWTNRMLSACQAFLDDARQNDMSTHLVMIDAIGVLPQDHFARASTTYERAVQAGLDAAPDGIGLSPLAPQAIVGGTRHLMFSRLLPGRERRLPALIADELLDWVSAYRTPAVAHITTPKSQSTKRPGSAPTAFLAGADERSRALGAIAHLSLDRGYPEIAHPQIAQFAEISPEAFLTHFSGKDDCFLALIDAFIREAQDFAIAKAKQGSDWAEATYLGVTALLEYFALHPGLSRLAFVDIYDVGPAIVDRLSSNLDAFTRLLAHNSPQAQCAPRLASEVITGAVWSILSSYARRKQLRHLSANLGDQVAFLVLAPYLGPKAAVDAIQRAG
jgi:putative PIN family toxin of toxin-antitoxin system